MALTASHIRFALDLKDKLQVKNVPQYITGTMYPDSRYRTRVNRDLTHPENFRDWDINSLDDFRKGWLMHLYCDELQSDIFKREFPDFFDQNPTGFGTDTWVVLTALKLLQDMDDLLKFDIRSNLPDIKYAEAHNDESLESIIEFYDVLHQVYDSDAPVDFTAYKASFIGLGLPAELGDSIIEKAKELQQDQSVVQKTHATYEEMIQNCHSLIN
jgi:hypothetical protein